MKTWLKDCCIITRKRIYTLMATAPTTLSVRLGVNALGRVPTTFVLISYLLVSSCSGIDGSGVDTLEPTPPVSSPKPTPPIISQKAIIAEGPIEYMDTMIMVNDLGYDAASAEVFINGKPGQLSDIEEKHMVTVSGVIDEGSENAIAKAIYYHPDVQGPIEAIFEETSMITVMSQDIIINDDTLINVATNSTTGNKTELSDLTVGDRVEITFITHQDNYLLASRISALSEPDTQSVTGYLQNVDLPSQSFSINNLFVDYTSAQLDEEPVEGAFKQVISATTFSPPFFLSASTVQTPPHYNDLSHDGLVYLQGDIATMESTSRFNVLYTTVLTDENTVISGGTLEDLNVFVNVHIEGRFNENRELLAETIEIVKLATPVDPLSVPKLNTFTIAPTEAITFDNESPNQARITLLGQPFDFQRNTITTRDDWTSNENWTLENLQSGDWVKVSYEETNDSTLNIKAISRVAPQINLSIQGRAKKHKNAQILLNEHPVQLTDSTIYTDGVGNILTRDVFHEFIFSRTLLITANPSSSNDQFIEATAASIVVSHTQYLYHYELDNNE